LHVLVLQNGKYFTFTMNQNFLFFLLILFLVSCNEKQHTNKENILFQYFLFTFQEHPLYFIFGCFMHYIVCAIAYKGTIYYHTQFHYLLS
jgi:hypothetical protein